jgi:hypothetical protein
MNRIWIRLIGCGQSVDKVWTKCGQSVDKVWTECGQNVDRMWTECGQNVVKVEVVLHLRRVSG